MRLFTLAYAILLVYGTLFPLTGWRFPIENIWDTLLADGVKPTPPSDIITNVLVYIPFGLLLFDNVATRLSATIAVMIAVILGTSLSISLETIQAFIPQRVPSILDVILNAGGTGIGAILARGFRYEIRVGHWLIAQRKNFIVPTEVSTLGLFGLGLWSLSHLSPLVPSIDVATLWFGLKPVIGFFEGKSALNTAHAAVYFFTVLGLGFMSDKLVRPEKRRLWFIGFVSTVLLLKIPIVSRQLSIEALAGSGVAFVFYWILHSTPPTLKLKISAMAIITAVVIDATRLDPRALAWDLHTFNWIPFRMHITHTLIGFGDILSGLWPFASLCYVAMRTMGYRSNWVGMISGLIVFIAIFNLEWNQQYIPGRNADLTDAILAWLAWSIAWYLPNLRNISRLSEKRNRREGRHF